MFRIAVLIVVLVATTATYASEMGDLVRDKSGAIQFMTFQGASDYCKSIGSRLPTIREFAELSAASGARGIIESAYPYIPVTSPLVEDEIAKYRQQRIGVVYAANTADTNVVDFYFDDTGYTRTSRNIEDTRWIWSSSNEFTGRSWAPVRYYLFDTYFGNVVTSHVPNPTWNIGVTCIK